MAPTGYFGLLTQAAVKAFQSAQVSSSSGAPQTTGYGQAGPQTQSEIANSHQRLRICGLSPASPDLAYDLGRIVAPRHDRRLHRPHRRRLWRWRWRWRRRRRRFGARHHTARKCPSSRLQAAPSVQDLRHPNRNRHRQCRHRECTVQGRRHEHRFCHHVVALYNDLELHWSFGWLPHPIRRRRRQFGQLRDFEQDRHGREHASQHFLNFIRLPDNHQRNHHLDHQPGSFLNRLLRHHHRLWQRLIVNRLHHLAFHHPDRLIASTTYHSTKSRQPMP